MKKNEKKNNKRERERKKKSDNSICDNCESMIN